MANAHGKKRIFSVQANFVRDIEIHAVNTENQLRLWMMTWATSSGRGLIIVAHLYSNQSRFFCAPLRLPTTGTGCFLLNFTYVCDNCIALYTLLEYVYLGRLCNNRHPQSHSIVVSRTCCRFLGLGRTFDKQEDEFL